MLSSSRQSESSPIFLDTNILLYAYDFDDLKKNQIARQILHEGWTKLGSVVISVQVLQEFYVNFTRKGYSKEEATLLIEDFCHWPVIDNTLSLFGMGVSFSQRWKTSLWDGLILAAAQQSGAKILLSEDLNHGQVYGEVRVKNPFHEL